LFNNLFDDLFNFLLGRSNGSAFLFLDNLLYWLIDCLYNF
jgi:hypothetical protein